MSVERVVTMEPAGPASNVLTDLARAINRGPGTTDVQALVVEKAVAALGASAGSVMMPGDGPHAMCVVAALGLTETPEMGPPESSVAEWVVRHDQPLLLIGRTGPLAHLLHREDIRDAVCVPLRYGGRPIGALSVSNSRHRDPFNDNDVETLTAIGHLAAVALQNTRLYDEAREHRELLQAVLHRLWTAQEEERRCLASDLHDGPAQSLFHIVFQLQAVRQQVLSGLSEAVPGLEAAEAAARETLAQVRGIMSGLRPMALDDLGLVPALRSECAAITARGRVNVDVRVTGDARRMAQEVETGLFRIAREALTNVERHAGSDTADVDLQFQGEELVLTVEDRGCGFNGETAQAARRAGRVGLVALQERADALGIRLDVESRPDQGTRVTARCPVRTDPSRRPEGRLDDRPEP